MRAETSVENAVLSIVVPAHNEAEGLRKFYLRLTAVLKSAGMSAEIVFVNDGSTDGTLALMEELRRSDQRIAIVDLSRNFGKEIAMTAGLDHTRGAAVVIIDADLQDPPELIPELIKRWREGFDVVYAKRMSRSGETTFKKLTAFAFYRLIHKVSNVRIPRDTGDFRLLSRRAVDSLKQLRERHRFMKGLFAWIGYPQAAVPYQRDSRFAGETKWRYWGLWNFAIEGITSFTIAPLKIATYLGMFVALAAFAYAGYIIYDTIVYGNPVAGYPSLLVIVLSLGGVQLMTLGVIGEYLGRMFNETKARPLYLVQGYKPAISTCETPIGDPAQQAISGNP
ncbi:MAG: glycosyltransferase family 2 protein [Burkholderiales bacterium]